MKNTAVTEVTPAFSVEIISDYQSFLDLEPVWSRLGEEAGIDDPFLTHEWIRTWWECFGAGKQLHILVVRADDEPVAIAPFLLTVERMYGFKVRLLQSISNEHTPRFDFILTRWPKEACRAIWNHLSNQLPHWDVIELQHLPRRSKILTALPRLATEDAFLTGLWHSFDSPYLPLHDQWEEYFKRLDRKFRTYLRSRLKRLNSQGEVRIEMISTGEKLKPALEKALQIEATGWKGDAGTAIRSHPEVSRFYTKFAERAVDLGWLRLYFLTINQQRIAFIYQLSYKNKLFILKQGYDRQYASYSPGHLLACFVLREAFKHGWSEYDLLGMADSWKLKWARRKRSHTWVFVFPKTWRMFLPYVIKFIFIPKLQRSRIYRFLRDIILDRIKSYALLFMSPLNADLISVLSL